MPEGRATTKMKKGNQAEVSWCVNNVCEWCQVEPLVLQLVQDSTRVGNSHSPYPKGRGVEDGKGRFVKRVSVEDPSLKAPKLLAH